MTLCELCCGGSIWRQHTQEHFITLYSHSTQEFVQPGFFCRPFIGKKLALQVVTGLFYNFAQITIQGLKRQKYIEGVHKIQDLELDSGRMN